MFANIAPSEVADPWVSLVVPHELTHIVFDTATRNVYHSPPHWLNEGLADYLAVGYASDARGNVERAVRNGDLMPLHALVLRFPSTADRFSLGYDESVSAVDYLVRTHGQEALVQLIRSYADGLADDDAFTAALNVDVAGFEAGWLGGPGRRGAGPVRPATGATRGRSRRAGTRRRSRPVRRSPHRRRRAAASVVTTTSPHCWPSASGSCSRSSYCSGS